MGTFGYTETIEGDVYIQRLSTYVRRNEEALANGLLCFSKNRNTAIKVKPLRLTFTIHHLYYITERIESSPLGVDVGPLNVKLDNPNHEPTFISFMANNARASKHFDSDTRSISSINSMKSIVSSASVYWRSFALSKDPKVINKDIKYLYSSFTKIPCLILTPKTKINSITSYEEYPCDTSVPLKMFKNLQVLEIVDYDPNEVFGWHILSEQLRILIVRNSKLSSINELLFNLVIDDESGRSTFNTHKQTRKFNDLFHSSGTATSVPADESFSEDVIQAGNNAFRYPKRERATTTSGAGSLPKESFFAELNSSNPTTKDYQTLPDSKWSYLKQLTVSETSITSIPAFIFKPLTNLVKLNLSNNLLEELPDGLDQLINIKYLNFADNYITDLRKLPTNLAYLSAINFNNNKLSDLSGLENLSSLEKIDLRRNELQSLQSLKPIVLQFIKNPQVFNNVYLSNNKLPKTYRSDLFNLINGAKYKNNMKIDDSRPGYFESALLLDSENSFKYLEKFLKESDVSKEHTPADHDVTAIFNGVTQDPSPPTPIPDYKKGHRRAHTLEALMEPFSVMKIVAENDENADKQKRKYELSHSVFTTSPTVVQSDSNSISSTLKTPNSPLSTNHNLINKLELPSTYSSKATLLSVHLNGSNPSISGSPSNMKKSSTLSQLDMETASISTTTAPNVVTPVQVTARMST
ncbi:L domain-like protein [Suhomyces tanzawaensis NRRL Y-17324]|uniref:L domain-like protein n=1 Tax=Suhomyces tanzawaensis NRRL Y-17324 TaxID=984487 RepID=A0A1E4SNW7_9ASCO|nr:L domain-like protein [Suhomyces tanzawaensis NRRL Y-17324]ODV81082.1 L domain-like protein [Suhomyces tanzawaensis NRRL Y-17324]